VGSLLASLSARNSRLLIIETSDEPYAAWKHQTRNEWMVDNSAAIIAVWDGKPSGTANTVEYAQKQGKPVLVINPAKRTEEWLKR
jgi:predicted Rossmann fold nucleotide-binding protein DprA/Smf involved in DNA uptake